MSIRPTSRSPVPSLAGLALAASLIAACSSAARPPAVPAADVIFTGDFVTLDRTRPRVEALAVKGGRIVAAGARADAMRLATAATATVAIPGVAVPGWADAHVHSADMRGLDPRNLRGLTKPQILARVAELAKSTPAGERITAGGWDQGFFVPSVFPTAADLDAVSGDHPVVLTRIDGHSSWVNSLVLTQAGITRRTPDPAGGRIVRGASGEATGLLVDRAQRLIPPASAGRPDPAGATGDTLGPVRAELLQYARLGYTSIHPAGVDAATIAAYKTLAASADGLPVRVYAMARGESTVRQFLSSGPEVDIADGQLAIRSFKYVLDGALGSRGALLTDPYADAPRERGLSMMSDADLDGVVQAARGKGFQLNVHAIGDRAVTRVLDAFERGGVTPADRFRIEHASMVAPADVPRFARLGVIASMQPGFIGEYTRWAADRVGPARIAWVLPLKTLLSSGAVVACGTDYEAADSGDPVQTLSALVAGASADGTAGAAWFMPQRVDVDTALRCMSEAPAFAAFQERDLGALTVGRRADFTVLSADPYTTPPDALRRLTVRMTVMGGRVRYDAGAAGTAPLQGR